MTASGYNPSLLYNRFSVFYLKPYSHLFFTLDKKQDKKNHEPGKWGKGESV